MVYRGTLTYVKKRRRNHKDTHNPYNAVVRATRRMMRAILCVEPQERTQGQEAQVHYCDGCGRPLFTSDNLSKFFYCDRCDEWSQ
jgi:hypothetical protein